MQTSKILKKCNELDVLIHELIDTKIIYENHKEVDRRIEISKAAFDKLGEIKEMVLESISV